MFRKSSRKWLAVLAVSVAFIPFAQVQAAGSTATKPVKLSWKIPVTRENGAPLRVGDLAGYELYYVRDDQKVSGVIQIKRADQVNYAVNNLQAGTYFFAISAIDRQGAKSKLSSLVSAKVTRS